MERKEYTMIEWRFPSNDFGESKGINDSGAAMFKGAPLSSLAREICQNSLDAAINDKVKIQFNMFNIKSESIPGRNILKDTFNRCLKFWELQKTRTTKDFFNDALNCITEDECCFLRISDFNTTGLTGSKEEINTNWTNLTKSSGVSDKLGAVGGSYGIGKFAPFACSRLATVFYSTYDIEEQRASQGVARLVTFTRADGQNTQGIGYYGNERNTPIYEELNLDPDFSRQFKEYGTDIYIAGYKFDNDDWGKDIIVSILDGFLGAIWREKLEVQVGDIVISKSSLKRIIEEYHDELTGYTEIYYQVLTSKDTVWKSDDFFGMGKIELGLLLGKTDIPKRIAMIRKTGMKIMDKNRLPGNIPYAGIMFIDGDEINEKLRLIENPEHTKWEPKRAANPTMARQLLRAISDFIEKQVEELFNSEKEEMIDAAGVGMYIPDVPDDSINKSIEEVVSDKILEVEVEKAVEKSISRNEPGLLDSVMNKEINVKKDNLGNQEKWFHTDGRTIIPGRRPGQLASEDINGNQKERISEPIKVSSQKFVCMCIDKNKGKYLLKITPDKTENNGVVELFLSGETNRFPLMIKNAKVINGTGYVKRNKIIGLSFKKGEDLRISIEIDYYDYCSMEVVVYATSK